MHVMRNVHHGVVRACEARTRSDRGGAVGSWPTRRGGPWSKAEGGESVPSVRSDHNGFKLLLQEVFSKTKARAVERGLVQQEYEFASLCLRLEP